MCSIVIDCPVLRQVLAAVPAHREEFAASASDGARAPAPHVRLHPSPTHLRQAQGLHHLPQAPKLRPRE